MSLKPIIEVKNLEIKYGKNYILEGDNSFSINPGEIVLILGENGTGKSSILKSIFRELSETNGDRELWFKGEKIDNNKKLDGFRRSIAYSTQDDDSDKYFYRNVWNFVLDYASSSQQFIEKKLTKTEIEEKVNKVFDELDCQLVYGIKNLKTHKLAKCSGGQKKLANILRCLSRTEADLYIFDEPLNNLDAYHARKLNNYLVDLVNRKDNPPGILIITHCPIFQKVNKVYHLKGKKLILDNDYFPKNCYGSCVSNFKYLEEE